MQLFVRTLEVYPVHAEPADLQAKESKNRTRWSYFWTVSDSPVREGSWHGFAVSFVMGREHRIQEADLHYHVIARCNNRAFHFETDEDFEIYMGLMRLFKKKHRFQLFNYELMSSHVHLFLQPSPTISLGTTMHAINWHFANDYNKRKKRKGHFWMGRYKSIPVDTDEHALTLMRYINRNAVRAKMVSKPGDWRFSGYRYYALGEQNDLLTPHPTYLGLAENEVGRQTYYESFVCQVLPEEDVRDPRWSDGRYIGSPHFGQKIGLEKETRRRKSADI